MDHSGTCEAIATLKESDDKQWEAINGMRAWVIAGMGSLLVQAILIIMAIVFKKTGIL
jgi:hypothetical protein